MILFFDTETTGTSSNDRVVQLAWLVLDSGFKEVIAHDYIIYPDGFEIPVYVTKIHGISTERACREGRSLGSVLDLFIKDVNNASYIVAHNLNFDLRMICSELNRINCDINWPLKRRQICTMKSSRDFCALPKKSGNGYKNPKLAELYEKLFDEGLLNAHDALVDTRACARAFVELAKLNVINDPDGFSVSNSRRRKKNSENTNKKYNKSQSQPASGKVKKITERFVKPSVRDSHPDSASQTKAKSEDSYSKFREKGTSERVARRHPASSSVIKRKKEITLLDLRSAAKALVDDYFSHSDSLTFPEWKKLHLNSYIEEKRMHSTDHLLFDEEARSLLASYKK